MRKPRGTDHCLTKRTIKWWSFNQFYFISTFIIITINEVWPVEIVNHYIAIPVTYIIFYINHISIKNKIRTSLMVQWVGIRLPMQVMWVWSLVWENSTCHGATKPMCYSSWVCTPELLSLHSRAPEPALHSRAPEPALQSSWACAPELLSLCTTPELLSLSATTAEAHGTRTCALQQEKPRQWEAHAPQLESSPAHHF